MIRAKFYGGFTLIEVIAVVIIAAAVAALGIQHFSKPGTTAQQRSCDTSRELLQGYAQHFFELNGRFPSNDLKSLATPQYAGDVLPVCPITGKDYKIKNGVVQCDHGRHD